MDFDSLQKFFRTQSKNNYVRDNSRFIRQNWNVRSNSRPGYNSRPNSNARPGSNVRQGGVKNQGTSLKRDERGKSSRR